MGGTRKRKGSANKKKQEEKRRQKEEEKRQIRITNDFPFLVHDPTVAYIKRSKVIFIMRGLSGSGKSTTVNLIKAKYRRAIVCSADNFFYSSDGVYHYDHSKLGEAHNYCQSLTKLSCEKNKHVLVIDNTNIKRWEMKYYFGLAAQFNYVVVVVLPRTWWRFEPAELAKRNKHGVCEEVLRKKVRMFEESIPMYYGWMVNEYDSQKLFDLGRKYFGYCIAEFPDFKKFMLAARTVDGSVSF